MKKDPDIYKSKLFMGLLVPHQRQIQSFILYLVPNRADADDILQDTLAEMWNKFSDYQEGTNFIAWGLTIAKYKVYQFIQRSKSYRLHFGPDLLALLQQDETVSQTRHSAQEKIDVLKECVSKLQEKERKMLHLRYEKNLTFDGIAKQSGVSIPAIYKALGRIHAKLARCIDATLRWSGAV